MRKIILFNWRMKYLTNCTKRIFKYSDGIKYNPKKRYFAALLIQKHCFNWLYKIPNGIVFKLSVEKIKNIINFKKNEL